MNDRGEKIVNLAREMLRAEMTVDPPELAARVPISFKALCFTAILAALGGSAVTGWIGDARRPLTRYERVQLDALVFYAARQEGADEGALRREIENRVGASDFGDFTERDFRIARNYLQEKIR
jgi:hypothetical protein